MKKSQSPTSGIKKASGSLSTKHGKPIVLGEEDQAEAREAMTAVLQRGGSIGGNRTLFVDSMTALIGVGGSPEAAGKSPVAALNSSASFAALADPGAALDYKTLKMGANMNRTLALRKSASHMDSSLSIQRMGRELSIDRCLNQPELHERSPEKKKQGITSTQLLINDMSIELDDHNQRGEELLNETLPGSCKSLYAMQFRMQTDKANANFAQVSILCFNSFKKFYKKFD